MHTVLVVHTLQHLCLAQMHKVLVTNIKAAAETAKLSQAHDTELAEALADCRVQQRYAQTCQVVTQGFCLMHSIGTEQQTNIV